MVLDEFFFLMLFFGLEKEWLGGCLDMFRRFFAFYG